MPGHDTLLLVVPRGIARELENLGGEVFEYRREVDCGRPCESVPYIEEREQEGNV